MIAPKVECEAVKLDTRRIFVIGGKTWRDVSTTEILDLNAMSFKPGPTMKLERRISPSQFFPSRVHVKITAPRTFLLLVKK